MQATSAGGDRQELHERIRRHALAAAERLKDGEPSDLTERIIGDDAFGMDEERLQALMDPSRFIGRAPEQVDRFLRESVQPVLQRHSDDIERLGAPEVRV